MIDGIVDDGEDELEFILNDNKSKIRNQTDTLYEVIQPTLNCQLECWYCGQEHLECLHLKRRFL